jgi:hypothetical protein
MGWTKGAAVSCCGMRPTGEWKSRMTKAKPFGIPKREVWKPFKKVKANQGAAGVDGQSIAGSRSALPATSTSSGAGCARAATSLHRCDG